MKFLVLLLAIGCATASFYDALDKASDAVVADFILGMEKAPSLGEIVGRAYTEEAEQIEQDLKTEIGKTLKENLDSVLQRVKDSIEHSKQVGTVVLEKAKEVAEKLKELGKDAGEKGQELIERLKEKAKNWIESALDRFGLSKRSLVTSLHDLILENLDLENVLDDLRRKLQEKINVETIKKYVENVFGKLSLTGEAILKSLQGQSLGAVRDLLSHILPRRVNETKPLEVKVIAKRGAVTVAIAKGACMLVKYIGLGWGKNKLQSWIDDNIESKWKGILTTALKYGVPTLSFVVGRFCYAAAPAGPQNYSLIDLWQRLRNFFQGMGIELQEKFFKFAVWVKDVVDGGVANIKDRLEQVKTLANQVIENSRSMSKEVALEALEFFHPYKEDLGTLWDQLVETTRHAIG